MPFFSCHKTRIVAPEFRRRGIAARLLEAALQQLDRTRDITVTTFREDDPLGTRPAHCTPIMVFFPAD